MPFEAASAASERQKKMDSQDSRTRILRLMNDIPEGQLYPFDQNEKNKFDRAVAEIGGFEGLLLRTARRVPASSQTLAGLLVCMKDNPRLRSILGLEEVLLVASPLGRGIASVATVLEPPQKILAPDAPTLSPDRLPVRDVSVWPLNIRARLPFSLTAGQYGILLIERDWLSNVEFLELQDAQADERKDQEKLYFLEDALAFEDRIKSGSGTSGESIRFDRDGRTPRLAGEGIQLSIPSQISVAGGDAVAHGAFRLPARREWIVQPRFRNQKDPSSEPFVWTPERRADTPRAIVNGTLLFVQAEITNPSRINLQIPVYADGEPKPGDLVEGWFHVDLGKALTEPLSEDTYWVYFLVADHVDGPHRIVVLEPDQN
jgi:hypothetical protein